MPIRLSITKSNAAPPLMHRTAETTLIRHEIKALTGLRGFAAALIVVHHLGLLMLGLGKTALAVSLTQCGLLGMSLFFVLSGFVIQYNYAARISSGGLVNIKAFLLARFARLYPLYVAFVCANYGYNVTVAVTPAMASLYSASLPAYLFGVQSWVYSVIGNFNFSLSQQLANNAWSISTEAFLYLVFIPVALLWDFSKPSNRRGIVLVASGVIGRLLLIAWVEHGTVSESMAAKFGTVSYLSPADWIVYLSPYGRIFEFLVGMGLAEIWSANGRTPASAVERALLTVSTLVCLVLLYLVFSGRLYHHPTKGIVDNRVYYVYTLAVPALIYVLCKLEGLLTALVCSTPLMFLGEISYSLYLIHGHVMALFHVAGSGDSMAQLPLMAWRSLLALTVAISLAWLSYRWIEVPAKHLLLGRSRVFRRFRVRAADVRE